MHIKVEKGIPLAILAAALYAVNVTEIPRYTYILTLVLMIIGAWLCSKDKPVFRKKQ